MQNFKYKIVEYIKRKWYQWQNSKYYQHDGIDHTVLFSASFPGPVLIQSPQKIEIGEYSVINANSILNASGGLTIGRHSHFGAGLTIYTSNHDITSSDAIPYGFKDQNAKVTIHDFVWMGANVSVLPGVEIGEGVVIGMGSVVTKDCPPLSIVAGNPAMIKGYRDKNLFEDLKRQQKFN